MTKAVFMDRDGTINQEVDFLRRPQDVKILPGVAEGLVKLKAAGFALVLISNQSGLARGIFDEQDLTLVQIEIKRQLGQQGARMDGAYFCPHHPSQGKVADLVKECDCRKPKPGLILMAAEEMGLSLNGSYMIGDRLRDVAAGKAVGLKAILVQTGRHMDDGQPKSPDETPDFIAADFSDATQWILSNENTDC